MARLLFRLAQVPDDEAQDIRELLAGNDIAYYETDAGFWRVGVDAIWLRDEAQLDRAQALILAYQQERRDRQQASYAELISQGQAPSAWRLFLSQPFRYMGLLLAIVFVLMLTLLPFIFLMF